MKKWYLLLFSLVLVFFGGLLAWNVQTAGGSIDIKDVRFVGTNGTLMSGLLYVPEGVTAEDPAPGILAVHGYINTRETHAAYAIEFARRGYVVLALDQIGHGYSDPPAFANGFGGPDALTYLRSLDIVDTANIGLEGHSMGGWTVLAAAATFPDDYTSINIQGSSTGAPFAQEGTDEWPRNFALTFSTWDEFSLLMWGTETATEIAETDKLKTVFGVEEIVEGEVYGSIDEGTARVLYQPVTTHPGDHLNSAAVATAIGWMQMTLDGGADLDPNNQVWMWNEIGRLIALIGMVLAVLAFGTILLDTAIFESIVQPLPEAKAITGTMRYVSYALTIFVPVLTYFWFQLTVRPVILPVETALFPQNETTKIMVWAVGNGGITLVLFLIWHFRANREAGAANYGLGLAFPNILKSIVAAIIILGFGYALVARSDQWFKTDFRFCVVAVKLLSGLQLRIFFSYLPFFLFFFVVASVALHGQLRMTAADGTPVPVWRAMLANVGLLVIGFIVLLAIQYIPLLNGSSLPLGNPLETIVAIQFVPLLTIAGLWMTWFFRKTGTIYVGAFTAASFIVWVIVAGQATHFAF